MYHRGSVVCNENEDRRKEGGRSEGRKERKKEKIEQKKGGAVSAHSSFA